MGGTLDVVAVQWEAKLNGTGSQILMCFVFTVVKMQCVIPITLSYLHLHVFMDMKKIPFDIQHTT